MIVPMVKYCFVIHHADKDRLIDSLMQAGVVDISVSGKGTGEEWQSLEAELKEIQKTLHSLKKRRHQGNPGLNQEVSVPAVREIAGMEGKLEQLYVLLDKLETEIRIAAPFGEIDLEKIHRLEAETGVRCLFFSYPTHKLAKDWEPYLFEVVNTIDRNSYILVFHRGGEMNYPAAMVQMPVKAIQELQKEYYGVKEEIYSLEESLNDIARYGYTELKARLAKAFDQLQTHLAGASMIPDCDEQVLILQGWSPTTKASELISLLEATGVTYLTLPVEPTDNVPVLLKNNRLVRLFEPIGNLFSLPNYGELDLTVFFAPFFLLFFGFCLGDTGYGLLLLAISLVWRSRAHRRNRPFADLLLLLGVSTMVIGFFTGTFFGFELANFSSIDPISHLFLDQNQLFNLALVIGFIQIQFALLVHAFKSVALQGWPFGMNRIGWFLLLTGLADRFVLDWLGLFSSFMIGIGLFFVVAFGAPGKGWLKSMAMGVVDLYNITGFFGDLLSYIRLFALGVSSAILGLVVNNISLELTKVPYVGWVLFLVLMIVGHGANLALATLSAFVHPMRLTFVEFYKNAGFEGGGKAYRPLSYIDKSKSNHH
jgi:V/A-type H+/Na+-transporting ATPase subunit I